LESSIKRADKGCIVWHSRLPWQWLSHCETPGTPRRSQRLYTWDAAADAPQRHFFGERRPRKRRGAAIASPNSSCFACHGRTASQIGARSKQPWVAPMQLHLDHLRIMLLLALTLLLSADVIFLVLLFGLLR
jgi:hypothetical protein